MNSKFHKASMKVVKMEASKGEMVSAYLQVPIISRDIPVTVRLFTFGIT